MMREKTGLIIGLLVIIILVLGGLVLYSYVGKPYISGYNNNIYNQGANDALTVLINQVQSRGYAEIPLNNNQVLVLVPVQPNTNAVQPAETTEEISG